MIVVQDAAKHIAPLDGLVARARNQWHRAGLIEALVRPPFVVEPDEGSEHPLQVPLILDEQPVQARLPRRPPGLRFGRRRPELSTAPQC